MRPRHITAKCINASKLCGRDLATDSDGLHVVGERLAAGTRAKPAML